MSRFQSIDHAPDQSNWHVGFNKYLIDRIFDSLFTEMVNNWVVVLHSETNVSDN
jgi:hypothetical protein